MFFQVPRSFRHLMEQVRVNPNLGSFGIGGRMTRAELPLVSLLTIQAKSPRDSLPGSGPTI